MGILAGKIVLTGGPCAGKTTALSKLENDLTEKGYRVFVIAESATEHIQGGIRPFGNAPVDLMIFQKLLIDHQLSKEKIYKEAVDSLDKDQKCVIICDRGIMDNKAYVGQAKFTKILKAMNLNELIVMDNYDLVIHMVTAADGKEKCYTLENNAARTETIDQAKELDTKTLKAWLGHERLKIVDNSTEFEEKINRTLDAVHELLGEPISLRQQRKYAIDLRGSTIDLMNDDEYTRIEIEQTYLINEEDSKIYEKRLRKRTYEGESTYYLTIQKKQPKGFAKVILQRKVSEEEYLQLLNMHDEKYTINKTRYTFTRNKQYFRLDVFDNKDDLAILEVEPTKENQTIELPPDLLVIADVTDDQNFQNNTLASAKNGAKQIA